MRIKAQVESLYESLRTLRSARDQAKEVAARAKEGGFGEEMTEDEGNPFTDDDEAGFEDTEVDEFDSDAEATEGFDDSFEF